MLLVNNINMDDCYHGYTHTTHVDLYYGSTQSHANIIIIIIPIDNTLYDYRVHVSNDTDMHDCYHGYNICIWEHTKSCSS